MGRMVEGEWTTDWYEPDEEGHFRRPDTQFRDWVRKDGSTDFQPVAGRYHLYVAYACPWASRVLMLRKLKGLEDAIDYSVVHPFMSDDGWHFDASEPGATADDLFGYELLREVYSRADSNYTGRVTVPVLWDKQNATIVNNESKELIQMLDYEFDGLSTRECSLFPAEIRSEVLAVIDEIYEPINNGVYRCGFAGKQTAYEQAAGELFDALDRWEQVLAEQRYLCGAQFTAADICMFTTLVRFDPVYYTHFKTNLRRIVDYPNLWNYVKEIYQMPGVVETVNMDHIKRHYFQSHETINPKRIVPIGPAIDFEEPHDRDRFD